MDTQVVQAECRWCGEIYLAARSLRCEVTGQGEGLCEFACPFCRRPSLVVAAADQARSLWRAGAGRIPGAVPFELLKRHDGPAISWDDVLDFHLALDATCCPQTEAAA